MSFREKTVPLLMKISQADSSEIVKLRTTCTHAEFWNPYTTERKDAALTPDKMVKLHLKPYESVFIVLTGKQ